ncbi:Dual specificity protein phosphatase 1 [Glycine soja]|nr:Dual specificity protein phosphatase 1 [Glycine soja]
MTKDKEQLKQDPTAITTSSQNQNQAQEFQGKGEVEKEEEAEAPLTLSVTSKVLNMLGDITAGPASMFAQWLQLVRKRTSNSRTSGFPHRSSSMPSSPGESIEDAKNDQQTEFSLWERLGKAEMLDIESSSFSWDRLSSLHHTEHTSSNEHSEDEINRALEVTVNSGGVVFFAFFNGFGNDDASPKEAAAVIKISSSRMATQSERLGYEFAKQLGVQTPQARVIHNTSLEWTQIKEATEKARDVASSAGDEVGEMTCTVYVHSSPLLESTTAFESQELAERTSAALDRIMLLDLVIRNEDRLPCRQLRWRGNSANLLLAEKIISGTDTAGETPDSAMNSYGQRANRALQKEKSFKSQTSLESMLTNFIVAIDSGVPRRPPVGKRTDDQVSYPKLVELLLNSSEFSSNLLHDITGGRLGFPHEDTNTITDVHHTTDVTSVVHVFRSGFRAALRDLQGFHIFLLTLHQKLDNLLRSFMNAIGKISSGESEKEDAVVPGSASPTVFGSCPSPSSKERLSNDIHQDCSDSESQRTAPRASSSSGKRDCCDSASSVSREGWHGKHSKGSADSLRALRLTTKLRDLHKLAKVDSESHKEFEHWNEMLKNDAVKLCLEHNFNTGFFEGCENNTVVDAYELKVRLEHILERIACISEAANTEKPSAVTNSLFIGGALAARSTYTLQRLGITHILCLCTNEIGQSDSQFPDLFMYTNFSVCDTEDSNISSIFEEACDFIDYVEQAGRSILVHCFEGKSRSATLVLAYLMLRKKFTLLEAWSALKRVHRRSQPNDGFAKILLELDLKLHGKVSMEWQQRKPMMKVCPICGKNAGLSSSSLKLHLQKSLKRLSSGSVDSAMTMEIQKALTTLKISRGGSVSPKPRKSHSTIEA